MSSTELMPRGRGPAASCSVAAWAGEVGCDVIVWLNGTFGVGKTSTAGELVKLLPDARIFDSEYVGFMLRHVLTEPVDDFQDWPPWRPLVVQTAVHVLGFVGGCLVVPQTVLVEDYAREIFGGFRDAGIAVRHFVLHAEEDELVRRITEDTGEDRGARDWRLDHVAKYQAALPWLREAGEILDTTSQPAPETARDLAARVRNTL